jgi:hypothetical protein
MSYEFCLVQAKRIIMPEVEQHFAFAVPALQFFLPLTPDAKEEESTD